MRRSESVSPLGVGVPVTNETLIQSAARRLVWLAPNVVDPAAGDARAGRELQRRDAQAGCRWRRDRDAMSKGERFVYGVGILTIIGGILWLVSLMDDSRPSVVSSRSSVMGMKLSSPTAKTTRLSVPVSSFWSGRGDRHRAFRRGVSDQRGVLRPRVLTATGLSDLKDEARLIFPRPTASDAPARQ